MNTDCLFCKIVAGEVPVEKVYEDEDILAFLDIKPINPGHTLIIPKEHYENIFDAPEAVFEKMATGTKKMALALKIGLNADNINIGMNNGPFAGQLVPHAHIHVMPRHEGDGYEAWHGKHYQEGVMKEIADKIKNAL